MPSGLTDAYSWYRTGEDRSGWLWQHGSRTWSASSWCSTRGRVSTPKALRSTRCWKCSGSRTQGPALLRSLNLFVEAYLRAGIYHQEIVPQIIDLYRAPLTDWASRIGTASFPSDIAVGGAASFRRRDG